MFRTITMASSVSASLFFGFNCGRQALESTHLSKEKQVGAVANDTFVGLTFGFLAGALWPVFGYLYVCDLIVTHKRNEHNFVHSIKQKK